MNVSVLLIVAVCAWLAGAAQLPVDDRPVPLWGRWEKTFTSSLQVAADVELSVEFSPPRGGQSKTLFGYWDGDTTWRVRFLPDQEGRWRFRTRSVPAVEGLDGVTGHFRVVRTRPDNAFLRHGPVRTSRDRHSFTYADGTPFFWMGDTAWNGALLSSERDWRDYLGDRAGKRFSAIQFVMTQWRTAYTNAEGQVAYTGRERIEIRPEFFRRMDARIEAINRAGLLAAPVLLWAISSGGGAEHNPGHYLPEDQAIRLARYMVARYGAHHVVWILGGDARYEGDQAEKWKRIGRAVFGEIPHATPVTLHPQGMQWPFEEFRNEAWIDWFGYQSGHGDDARALAWNHSGPPSQRWKTEPARPILNLEPCYEDHLAYQSRLPVDSYKVRRAAYWSLMATPPAGLTYGAHGIWSWETQPRVPLNHERTGLAKPWRQAKDLPGSTHMKHLVKLFSELRWWQLRPDETLIRNQSDKDDPARHISALRSEAGDRAVAYLPVGGALSIEPGRYRSGQWFDPRTGKTTRARRAADTFQAPDNQDWILILRR